MDQAEKIISSFFGSADWRDLLSGSFLAEGSVMISLLSMLNVIALTVLSVMSVYMLMVGTMGTAHEGTPLGKKYHSFYAPMRLAFAFSFLAPLPVIGISMMQIMIVGAISTSFTIANTATDYVADFLANNAGAVTIDAAPNMSIGDNAYRILQAHTISHAIERESAVDVPVYADDNVSSEWKEDFIGSGGKWIFTIYSSHPLISTEPLATIELVCKSVADAECVARKEQVLAINLFLDRVGGAVAAGESSSEIISNYDVLQRNIQATNESRAIAASEPAAAIERQRLVAEMIKSKGWAGLGSFSFDLASANQRINKEIKLDMTTSVITEDQREILADTAGAGASFGGVSLIEPHMQRLVIIADKFDSLFPSSEQLMNLLKTGHVDEIMGIFSNAVMKMYYSTLDSIIFDGNAIVSLANLGQNMLGTADSLMVVGGVSKAIVGGTIFGMSAGDVIWSIAMKIAAPLFLAGFFLAFYLPALPFIIYTLATISVFIVIIEALVSAPLWCLGIAIPEGEGMLGGRGQSGFMILANVLLRPVLLVISFVAALVLTESISAWLATGLKLLASSLTANTLVGIPTLAALLVITVLTFLVVYHKIWSIINWLPDNVMKWIGGGIEAKMGGQEDFGGNFNSYMRVGGGSRLPMSQNTGSKTAGEGSGGSSAGITAKQLEPGSK